MKLDSIFKGLGIETMEDINKLSCFFIIKDQAKFSETGEIKEKLIHPNDATRAIRRFVESHRNDKLTGQSKVMSQNDDRLEGRPTFLIYFFQKKTKCF